ncbi:hypothetical protein LIER_09343 [Lithospermum erythrorhizon]|uniref:Uncharacterized protein n=1 Tax=Lithospermum erythrorhizon TaxID=34254 RepID=A0AAV3PGG3_LITER
MSETTDVSKPTVTPSVNASEVKIGEPPVIFEDHARIDASGGAAGDDNVSCVEDMMTKNVKGPMSQEEIDTMDANIEDMTPEKASQEKKKSKKRKLRKLADTVETSEPKKKLSKEERAAKRARKAERRARKVVEAKTAQDNDVEEVVPEDTEEVIPPVLQPSIEDEWLSEYEPQGDNEDD